MGEHERLIVAGREVAVSNPRKVLFPAGRPHQAGPRALLPRRRRRRAARRGRTAERAGPLPERHRRRVLLPEARAAVAAGVGRGRVAQLSVGPHRGGGRAARRGRAGVDGQPRVPRAASAPGARRGSRSSRRAARRSRSGARRHVGRMRTVARVVHATLDDFGLVGWPKTSGSRGIHVYVRIEPRWTFDEVRRAALAFAREVERRAPALATSKWWKEERHGVFLDYNQNAKDRTVAGAYSVRPTPDARVSAPLTWDEIDACEPADFTLATMPARFAAVGDRHAGIDEQRCSLERLLELSARHEREGQGDAPWPPQYQQAAGRAAARAAVAAPRVEPSAGRDRPRRTRRRTRWRASSAGARAIPRPLRISAAGRRPGRRDARPVSHLDAHPRQPAARAGRPAARAGGARSRRRAERVGGRQP